MAFSVAWSYTGFSHCHLCPASVSDETCFCDSTGDLGQQKKVPNEARRQVTDSECRGPIASGSLNWAAIPANEKPLPLLGRSLSHKPHLEHCRKRSGKCLWLGLYPGCPWHQLTSAARKGRGKDEQSFLLQPCDDSVLQACGLWSSRPGEGEPTVSRGNIGLCSGHCPGFLHTPVHSASLMLTRKQLLLMQLWVQTMWFCLPRAMSSKDGVFTKTYAEPCPGNSVT